ncbi:MAG: type II toxin-antitoxin system RelE/ParE family toxin [Rickettsiales bacterium]|jgi:proteic killer suppression protein|nr:type II toxin-antitoxin system RelE/ParE family toxin [Rickettsiales bacterium]
MIKSFACVETQKIFDGIISRKFPPDIQSRAMRRLILLDAAENLDDLRIPPSNHLEKLSGDRAGQYSIRINDKYRICFDWRNNESQNVEIVDYH